MVRQRGFTLLEMLIAIAIFVVLGFASYSVLSSVTRSNELSKEASEELKQLQSLMLVMERDFLQITPRKIRLEEEPPSVQPLNMEEGLFQSEAQGIQFARLGWRNPRMMLKRSTVQSVIYRIYEGKLQRLHFVYPDAVMGEEAKVRDLLSGVSALKFRFNSKQKWLEKWQKSYLPDAIEVEFESEKLGKIRRIFLTAGEAVNETT